MARYMHPTNDGAGGQAQVGRIADGKHGGPEPRRIVPAVKSEDMDRLFGKPYGPTELLRVAKGWLEGKDGRDNFELIADGSRLFAAVAIACEKEADNPGADKKVVDELAATRHSLFGIVDWANAFLYGSAGEGLIVPLVLPGVSKLLRSENTEERARAFEIVTDELALAEIAIEHRGGYPADVRRNALERLSARMDELGLAALLTVAAYSKDEKAVGAAKERIYGLMTGDERKAGRATEAFFSLFFRSLCADGTVFLQHALPVYREILDEKGALKGKTIEEIARTQWGQFAFEMERLLRGNGVFAD